MDDLIYDKISGEELQENGDSNDWILGFIFLRNYLNPTTLGFMFAAISGIMVYISIDTLLPMAREYGENHHVVFGVMLGMFFIGLSLVLF